MHRFLFSGSPAPATQKISFFDIGQRHDYFDDELNESIVTRIARECYLPMNTMLLNLIQSNASIKVSFSISGTALDEFEQFAPAVIESFQHLAKTGSVEFLAETNYHSLASVITGNEFEIQVTAHAEKIERLFGKKPAVFRNTELIYNDEIGRKINGMGYTGILCEGNEQVLSKRSSYRLYHHPDGGVKLLLRSNRLSDDIAFRFHHGKNRLTIKQYMGWLNAIPATEQLVVLGMDYETFGEHYKSEHGIDVFLKELLLAISSGKKFKFATPTEALQYVTSSDIFSTEKLISWADKEKDTSAWLGNAMQHDAFKTVVDLEADVKKANDAYWLTTWRNLLTSDHFYYMSTKNDDDGNVHSYFSHYASPYDAFMNYMNVLSDFALQLKNRSVTENAN